MFVLLSDFANHPNVEAVPPSHAGAPDDSASRERVGNYLPLFYDEARSGNPSAASPTALLPLSTHTT
jgi:hypothetical protein